MNQPLHKKQLGLSILSVLHIDHININRLLILIEKNIHSVRKGQTADLKLMAESIEYIGYYADIYHHPLEDILYDYFKGRDPLLTSLINRCEKEHQELKQITTDVLSPLSQTLLDGLIPMERILESLEEFLERELNHINFEEGELFPMLELIATEEDWQAIAQQSWAKTCSVFKEVDASDYVALYEALEQNISQSDF